MNATEGRPRLTIATRVTLARFLGIPVFLLLTTYYALGLRAGAPNEVHRVGALAVFLLVALTDALDGYLARSRNEITPLGKLLDPLADKTLLLTAIVALTRPGLPQLQPQLPVWFALVVISRDAMLVAGAVVIRHLAGRIHIQPRWTGKVSTFLQMLCVTWVLADGPARAVPYLCAAAAAFAVAAGLRYGLDGLHQIGHHAAVVPPPGPRGAAP